MMITPEREPLCCRYRPACPGPGRCGISAHRSVGENHRCKKHNVPVRLIVTASVLGVVGLTSTPLPPPPPTPRSKLGGGSRVRHVTSPWIRRRREVIISSARRFLCLVGRSSILDDLFFHKMVLWMPRMWRSHKSKTRDTKKINTERFSCPTKVFY